MYLKFGGTTDKVIATAKKKRLSELFNFCCKRQKSHCEANINADLFL